MYSILKVWMREAKITKQKKGPPFFYRGLFVIITCVLKTNPLSIEYLYF